MTDIEMLSVVALLVDLPEEGLVRGQVGTVVESWAPGVYSIAKFELVEQGSGTKIVFDHTGFPKGEAKVLASGWNAHYWEPIEKLLA